MRRTARLCLGRTGPWTCRLTEANVGPTRLVLGIRFHRFLIAALGPAGVCGTVPRICRGLGSRAWGCMVSCGLGGAVWTLLGR